MADYPWLAKYEEGVPHSIDIAMRPLVQVLRDAAQKYANQVALHMVLKYLPLGLAIQSRMTYRQLDQASDRFAAGLQKMGLAKGDRVAFALPDAERARSALRAAVAGLPPAPLVLQLTCRARDVRLHGDDDLESALVVSEARDRHVLGAIVPFSLAPDARGRPRIQVHRTLLLALGPEPG